MSLDAVFADPVRARRYRALSATTQGAAAAARAAAQAAAVALMVPTLGAAACAVRAFSLARPDRPDDVREEIRWRLERLSGGARAALRQPPAAGADSAGSLGAGLLTAGILGSTIRGLQAGLGVESPPRRRERRALRIRRSPVSVGKRLSARDPRSASRRLP